MPEFTFFPPSKKVRSEMMKAFVPTQGPQNASIPVHPEKSYTFDHKCVVFALRASFHLEGPEKKFYPSKRDIAIIIRSTFKML